MIPWNTAVALCVLACFSGAVGGALAWGALQLVALADKPKAPRADPPWPALPPEPTREPREPLPDQGGAPPPLPCPPAEADPLLAAALKQLGFRKGEIAKAEAAVVDAGLSGQPLEKQLRWALRIASRR